MVTWIGGLRKTRGGLIGRLRGLWSRDRAPDEESLEALEEALLAADVPPRLALELVRKLEASYGGLRVDRREVLGRLLVGALPEDRPVDWSTESPPKVVAIVGVNGSGKTTTCAKLADRARREGKRPLLGAADTFRAAGSLQLKVWAERIGCPVVTGEQGGDAAAVAYDAVESAAARGCDLVLLDTAGRMHTREPLMRELDKLRRAVDKRHPGSPHEVWAVLDATTGQNAIRQARQFHEVLPLTGVIAAKLDGSSKGGFLFEVARELGVPILFAGLGEGREDLVPFEREPFVEALLGTEAVE
jgi:fused signal recognition particle receptor